MWITAPFVMVFIGAIGVISISQLGLDWRTEGPMVVEEALKRREAGRL